MPAITIRIPPPRTEVGINEFCNPGMDFFKMLAANKLPSSTANSVINPQTLESQKFVICVTSRDIDIAVVDMYVFQSIEPLATLKLIDMFIIIDV